MKQLCPLGKSGEYRRWQPLCSEPVTSGTPGAPHAVWCESGGQTRRRLHVRRGAPSASHTALVCPFVQEFLNHPEPPPHKRVRDAAITDHAAWPRPHGLLLFPVPPWGLESEVGLPPAGEASTPGLWSDLSVHTFRFSATGLRHSSGPAQSAGGSGGRAEPRPTPPAGLQPPPRLELGAKP